MPLFLSLVLSLVTSHSAFPASAARSAPPPSTTSSNKVGFHPPLGPFVHLDDSAFAGVPSYSARDRLVLTPYFYWYDSFSGAHLRNADGSDALTDHPPSLTGFSYRSSAW
ncbi:MAG: hypothetical protein IT580_13315, partial [Verrucomicrobiales bacterium]|nr:hypothetical protein [Verrucomicrobiales bacterium]